MYNTANTMMTSLTGFASGLRSPCCATTPGDYTCCGYGTVGNGNAFTAVAVVSGFQNSLFVSAERQLFGRSSPALTPLDVTGLDNPDKWYAAPLDTFRSYAESVAMGPDETCVITGEGAVLCYAQDALYTSAPVLPLKLTMTPSLADDARAALVSVGPNFSRCILFVGGYVYCDGLRQEYADASAVVSLQAGAGYHCVVFASGAVSCPGVQYDGSVTNSTQPPIAFADTAPAVHVAAYGTAYCALFRQYVNTTLTMRRTRCWGANTALFAATIPPATAPYLNYPGSSFNYPVDVAVSESHACVLLFGGTAGVFSAPVCFGTGLTNPKLGTGVGNVLSSALGTSGVLLSAPGIAGLDAVRVVKTFEVFPAVFTSDAGSPVNVTLRGPAGCIGNTTYVKLVSGGVTVVYAAVPIHSRALYFTVDGFPVADAVASLYVSMDEGLSWVGPVGRTLLFTTVSAISSTIGPLFQPYTFLGGNTLFFFGVIDASSTKGRSVAQRTVLDCIFAPSVNSTEQIRAFPFYRLGYATYYQCRLPARASAGTYAMSLNVGSNIGIVPAPSVSVTYYNTTVVSMTPTSLVSLPTGAGLSWAGSLTLSGVPATAPSSLKLICKPDYSASSVSSTATLSVSTVTPSAAMTFPNLLSTGRRSGLITCVLEWYIHPGSSGLATLPVPGSILVFMMPQIGNAVPPMLPATGGTVTLTGINFCAVCPGISLDFVGATTVSTAAPVQLSTTAGGDDTIVVTVPPVSPTTTALGQVVSVVVSPDGGTTRTPGLEAFSLSIISFSTFDPKGGPKTGGTRVTVLVSASVLLPRAASVYLKCQFGGTLVMPHSVGTDYVDCVSPPSLLLDGVPLSIIYTPDNAGAISVGVFAYYDLVFTSISPSSVPSDSLLPLASPLTISNAVGITGIGFAVASRVPSFTAAPRLRILGSVLSGGSVAVSSDVNILFKSIDLAATVRYGSPLIEFALNGVDYQPTGLRLNFMEVWGVAPLSAPSTGGTLLSILGNNFPPDPMPTYCAFYSGALITTSVLGTRVNSGLVTCTVPPMPASGSLRATVSNEASPTGMVLQLALGQVFPIYPPPTATLMVPSRGQAGSVVTITGTNFVAPFSCWFGSIRATTSTMLGPTSATCMTPAGGSGQALSLSLNDQDLTLTSLVFQYSSAISVYPSYGIFPTAGLYSITLTASITDPAPVVGVCLFNYTASLTALPSTTPTYLAPNYLVCPLPAIPAQAVNVGVSVRYRNTLHNSYTSNSVPVTATITFYPTPTVSAVNPTFVMRTDAGSMFTLYGTNFFTGGSNSSVVCSFTGTYQPVTTPGFVANKNVSYCQVPVATGTLSMSISFNDNVNTHLAPTSVKFALLVSIAPTLGPMSGSLSGIFLSGSDAMEAFTNTSSRCRFTQDASQAQTVATRLSTSTTGTVRCDVPPAPAGIEGLAYVTYLNSPGLETAPGIVAYRYYLDPVITAVFPAGMSGSGPVPLTLFGFNFAVTNATDLAAIQCKFGKKDFSGISRSKGIATFPGPPLTQSVVCNTPNTLAGSNITLQISLNGGNDFSAIVPAIKVDFFRAYVVTPSTGPNQGNTLIIISGAGFSNLTGLGCLMSGIISPATVINAAKIQCLTAPQSGPADTSVEVTTLSSGTSVDRVQYRYYNTPIVTSVSPRFRPEGSVGNVTVYGSSFASDQLRFRCRFQGRDVAGARLLDPIPNVAICPLGPGLFGDINVQLSFNSGFSYTTISPFTVFTFTSVASIAPTLGPTVGGTRIALSGSGFYSSSLARCGFGAGPAPALSAATVERSDLTYCLAPPVPAPGTVRVRYTHDQVLFTNETLLFRYYDTPTVSAIYPLAGPSSGQFPLTLYGNLFPVFSGVSSVCVFGGAQQTLTSPVYVFNTTGTLHPVATNSTANNTLAFIVCNSPPKDGTQSIELSFNGGFDTTTSGISILYFTVASLSPGSGPAGVSNAVVLSGTHLAATATSACSFGTQLVTSQYVSGAQIRCVMPPAPAGVYRTEYTSDLFSFSTDGFAFTVYPTPAVTYIFFPFFLFLTFLF